MIAHHLFGKVSWDLKGNGQYPPYLDHKGVAEGFKIFFFFIQTSQSSPTPAEL